MKILTGQLSVGALFCYQIASTGEVTYRQTIRLDGNALDVAIISVSQIIIVSTDHVHEANSTRALRDNDNAKPGRIFSAFFFDRKLQSSHWQPTLEPVLEVLNQAYFDSKLDSNDAKADSVGDSLYTMETLRKRVQGDME